MRHKNVKWVAQVYPASYWQRHTVIFSLEAVFLDCNPRPAKVSPDRRAFLITKFLYCQSAIDTQVVTKCDQISETSTTMTQFRVPVKRCVFWSQWCCFECAYFHTHTSPPHTTPPFTEAYPPRDWKDSGSFHQDIIFRKVFLNDYIVIEYQR